jgi:hypothetical protein
MTPNEHKIYITLKGKEKSDFFKKISIRDTEERLKREKKEKKE